MSTPRGTPTTVTSTSGHKCTANTRYYNVHQHNVLALFGVWKSGDLAQFSPMRPPVQEYPPPAEPPRSKEKGCRSNILNPICNGRVDSVAGNSLHFYLHLTDCAPVHALCSLLYSFYTPQVAGPYLRCSDTDILGSSQWFDSWLDTLSHDVMIYHPLLLLDARACTYSCLLLLFYRHTQA